MKVRFKPGESHVSLTGSRKELEKHRAELDAFLSEMDRGEKHVRATFEANKHWIRGDFDPERHHVGSLSFEVVEEK